jgi:hypothetical protein
MHPYARLLKRRDTRHALRLSLELSERTHPPPTHPHTRGKVMMCCNCQRIAERCDGCETRNPDKGKQKAATPEDDEDPYEKELRQIHTRTHATHDIYIYIYIISFTHVHTHTHHTHTHTHTYTYTQTQEAAGDDKREGAQDQRREEAATAET